MHWHPNRFWAFVIVVWLWLALFFTAYGCGWRPDGQPSAFEVGPGGYIAPPTPEPIFVPIRPRDVSGDWAHVRRLETPLLATKLAPESLLGRCDLHMGGPRRYVDCRRPWFGF